MARARAILRGGRLEDDMRLWALAAAFLCVAGSARAQVPDCMTEGYLDAFQVAGVEELTCAEVFRFTIPTPGGEKIVRGIADLNADWAFRPGTVAAAEAAAREATAALPALGTYRIGDVTILLLSDQLRPEGTRRHHDRDVLAQAWDPLDRVASECRMTLFLWGSGGITENFPTTVAHELFHCVQYATLAPEQMATFTKFGDWWIEGSAEAYAAYAIADSRGTADHGATFNAAVSERMPLYKLSYEATIFFYWLIQTREIRGVLPFLAGMSNEIGAEAQRAAMREAMTDDEWLNFAEAYADERIFHPHGQNLGLQGRFPIEYRFIEASGTQRMTFEPFAVIPGMAEYECGRWENRLSEATLSSRLDSELDWQDGWRPEMDTRDGGERELRFVAMETGDTPREVTLRARRMAACEPCKGSTEIDRCMVGNWQGNTRPLLDMLRRAGAPVSRNAMGAIYLQVNEDGTFVTSDVPIDFQTTTSDDDGTTTVDVIGTAGRSTGRWSILGPGRLAGCLDLMDGTVATGQVEGPEISASVALFGAPGSGDEGSVAYSCAAGAMSTRVPMGRFGEVEFPFTRLSPPPEE
jgi:hypothetical protein